LKTSKTSSFAVAFICDAACKKISSFLDFCYMDIIPFYERNAFSAYEKPQELIFLWLILICGG
jgi:hypothetical protein